MLRALIWDVDGTLAETERDGHRVAFNQAFEQLGLGWHWDVAGYGELLRVAGGRERLLHFIAGRTDAPALPAEREALAREVHVRKNLAYALRVSQGHIVPRPGVLRLVAECRSAGVALAVATTSSRANVEALLASVWGAGWPQVFGVLVCAEDAPQKKPDPLVYRLALQRLGLAAHEAFVLEDSPDGLHAALAAGLGCGVTKSLHFTEADFTGATWVRDDLETPEPMTLARLLPAGAGNMGHPIIEP